MQKQDIVGYRTPLDAARRYKLEKEKVLKVADDGSVAEVALKGDAKDGSKITLKADQIDLKGKNINLTGDDVTISSTNFNVSSTGAVTASSLALTGGSITLGNNFSVDNNGNMTCSNANVSGTITSSNATITGGSMTVGNNFSVNSIGNMVCSNAVINGTLSQDKEGSYYNTKTNIGDPNNTGNCIEIFSYDKSTLQEIDRTYINPGNVVNYTNGNISSILGYGRSVQLYNEYNSRVIYLDGFTGNIECVSLTQTSKEEAKKNFEKLDNALDIIKSTDIYKYNLKDESNNDKKHIGFVIGDKRKYREEITSKDNDGVDIYSMVSVCFKAIQEQQETIEKLEKRIEEIERR